MNRFEHFIYPQKTLHQLLLGAFTALLFSAFIYLADIGVEIKALNTITALIAFWLLLHIPKKAVLAAGFFIGILWFYWISYSFKYTGNGAIAPLIVLGFGIIYMLFLGCWLSLTSPTFAHFCSLA